MVWTVWVILGALFAGLSVAFGAFGAHALKARLSPEMLDIFELGVRYQMYHALGLLALGLVASKIDLMGLKISGISFTVGIIIFSGSLYVLALTGQRMLGAITPIGGIFLLIGWFSLVVTLVRVS